MWMCGAYVSWGDGGLVAKAEAGRQSRSSLSRDEQCMDSSKTNQTPATVQCDSVGDGEGGVLQWPTALVGWCRRLILLPVAPTHADVQRGVECSLGLLLQHDAHLLTMDVNERS